MEENTATTEEKKPLLILDDIKKRPLSYSSLKHFKKSPKHFIHYRNTPKDKEESAALKFGNLLDCLLLTSDEFDQRYNILPETKLLKNCRDRAEYEHLNSLYDKAINDTSKIVVEQSDVDKAKLMVDVITQDETARKLIERVTEVQVEHRWTDKKTKLPVLCRMDGKGEDICFELKTAQDADPDEFYKDADKFGYNIQCAMELESFATKGKFPQFWYIVIEKTAPYGISVFQPSKDYIQLGKIEYRELMDKFKMCLDQNRFHEGYEFKSSRLDKTHELDVPPWKKYKLHQQ